MAASWPEVLVLDVNETLSDLAPLRAGFESAGLPGQVVDTWFAATLRDGFALTAAGGYASFRDVAADVLQSLLVQHQLDDSQEVVDRVLGGLAELPAHPDVATGLERLHEQGFRIITLANGAPALAERMLADAGVLSRVEQRLSVEQPGRWKPHPDAYRYAAEACGVEVARMALVAVHPWDIDGARRAGMLGYWLDRQGTPYPKSFLPPDLKAPDLTALAEALAVG